MSRPTNREDVDRFRLRCRQFRWLAIFMVGSVGLLLASVHLIFPVLNWAVHGRAMTARDTLTSLIWMTAPALYLFAVWSIGGAMGQLAGGRLIQPVLTSALRKVGLALGLGGLFSVFAMTNLLRLVQGGAGGWAYFDVSGMTLGMIGGALFLLGRVMEQADRVQAELDEMI